MDFPGWDTLWLSGQYVADLMAFFLFSLIVSSPEVLLMSVEYSLLAMDPLFSLSFMTFILSSSLNTLKYTCFRVVMGSKLKIWLLIGLLKSCQSRKFCPLGFIFLVFVPTYYQGHDIVYDEHDRYMCSTWGEVVRGWWHLFSFFPTAFIIEPFCLIIRLQGVNWPIFFGDLLSHHPIFALGRK